MDEHEEIELLVISWGSTSDVVEDVMSSEELQQRRVASLHYTYLWPLCTQNLQELVKRSKHAVLVEQNYQGQLGMLIRMESGLDIQDKVLKYDGRPFFYEELLSLLREKLVDKAVGQRVLASRSTMEKSSRGHGVDLS
jgi:2-oxoglutarate ferredoxin oxidoreductase subunit alpha